MFGEKETYKYLGILESNTIKKWRWRKMKKGISGKCGNYSKPKYVAENPSKG